MSDECQPSSVDLKGIELPSRRPAPPLGAVLPRIPDYHIIRLIGVGGMGAVWEAQQQHTRRIVALKVVRPLWITPQLLKRFEHEVEILGRLQHPGIAQIYEAGTIDSEAGPQPFFAMELVRGRRLDEYIAQTKPSLKQRLELLTRICDAVQHAHQHGVIHRDLKPANVLVTDDAQPKILDFGVARAIDSDIQVTTMHTDLGQLVGTLQYMSPEQATGHANQVDTRSDVYALGMIAYELLADRLPYELRDKPLAEAIRLIREEPGTRLSSVSRSLRGDIETIIGKALEKEPDRRYESPAHLSADIKRYLDYEPISARPPSTWYQLSRFARRNKLLVAGIVAIFLALSVGFATTSIQYLRTKRAERLARTQQQIAQKRFDDLRTLSNKFMFDFHEKIEKLPGSTPAVKMLVDTSLEYLNRLASDAGDDPQLLSDLATAYLRVGDIQGNPDNVANLGNAAGAMESYRKALDIFRRLADANKADRKAQHKLSLACGRLCDALVLTGDWPGALAYAQESLVVDQRLANEDPSDSRARRALGFSHAQLARLLHATSQPAEAQEHYLQSLQIRQQLAEARPENSDVQRELSVAQLGLGKFLLETGDVRGAREQFLAALELHQRLMDADPNNAAALRDVAVAQQSLADALAEAHDYSGSLAARHKALELFRRRADSDPTNAEAQRDVSVAHTKIGDLLATQGDWEAALPHYLEAFEADKRRADADPASARALRDVGVMQAKLGDVYLARGGRQDSDVDVRLSHLRQARSWYADSLKTFTQMQQSGKLPPPDQGAPEELRLAVVRCEQEIAIVQSSTTHPAASQQNRLQR